MAWRDKLHIFRFWSQKVLPQVYDDALSYYEVLNKVAAFLNECIEKINELIDEQEAYEDAMNQAWEAFKVEMKDEWKAYKVLMEATWNDFKQYILDNLDTWEEETRQQVIDNINNELEIIIANLKDELELYIDGTRTVTVHVTKENNVITADKTYTEIRNIINTGGYVIIDYADHIYRYQYLGNDDYIEWFEEGAYYTQVQPNYVKINTIIHYFLQVHDDNTWSEHEDEYIVTPDIGSSNYGKFLKSTSGGLIWGDVLPTYTQAESSKVLKVNSAGDNVEWGVDGTGDTLPSYGPSDANKVLKVNSSGNDIAWEDDDDTKELPNIVSGDGNKILRVKNDLSGVEWSQESKELPTYSVSDANKVLRLNGSGTDVEWGNVSAPTEVVSIGSSSSPALPSGKNYAYLNSILSADVNALVLVDSNNHLYRCRAVNTASLVFTHIEPVTGGTSADIIFTQITVTSSNVTSIKIRCSGTLE